MHVLAIVNTEYHLFLLINEVMRKPNSKFDIYMSKKGHGKRLSLNFNFTDFANARFSDLDSKVDLQGKLSRTQQEFLKELSTKSYREFIFFQQQDPLIQAILRTIERIAPIYRPVVSLYQDGLKPYNQMLGYSLEMVRYDLRVSKWLKRNGLRGYSLNELINSKRYGYNRIIDNLYLTFPKAYDNWNRKIIKQIDFAAHETFKQAVEKLFGWEASLLPVTSNVLMYLSQPIKSDSQAEVDFLRKLVAKTGKQIIFKLHPLTSEAQIQNFKKVSDDIVLIKSQIPAEIFLMNLSHSVALSLNSTSFFYESPGVKYVYLSNIFRNRIKRLRRYKFNNPPANHILMANNFEEITEIVNENG